MQQSLKAFNQQPLINQQLYLLIALLGLSALPHFFHLSAYIGLFFFLVISFRVITFYFSIKTLPRVLIFSFLLAGLISVVYLYTGKIGTDFGVSLLVTMLGLKVLEVKTYRDAYVLLFLSGFLLITQFLYNQEMIFSFYIFSLAFFLLVFLNWLNQPTQKISFALSSPPVTRLSLQAIPVMLIMFFLFPRLHGPLWGFDQVVRQAVTGISGEMSPGSISQLSRSSAVAFRVTFDDPGQLPAPEYRYWRGPVMTQTDGYQWQADKRPDVGKVEYEAIGQPVSYQLTAEPSQQHWIFALDLPGKLPVNTFITNKFSVRAKEKITQRSTYALTSYPVYKTLFHSGFELEQALYVPAAISDRTRNLAQSFQQKTDDNQTYIQSVLNHFNQQNFVYSLAPPQMIENPVDQFLFDYQKGFCEHYATSFVILMRLADIPARVVAGYQGGEWNPTGNHLVVRQSDAHAWAEVWLHNRGWVRIDPTSYVAPERIEQSIDPDVIPADGSVVYRIDAESLLGRLYRQVVWAADSLDLNWHRWVVGFTQKRQNFLLDSTGLGFLKGYKLGVAAVVTTFIGIILVTLFFRRKIADTRDQARIYWDRFTRKLQSKGLVVKANEGPESISQNACEQFPDQADAINLISRLYILVRYGGKSSPSFLENLKKSVSGFH